MADKGGRPKKDIDFDLLDRLLQIQCTLRECADFFGVSEDTIERRVREKTGLSFAEYSAQKKEKGKISLRRKQFEVALAGNVSMLIWLGKQYLGQKDKQEISSPEPVEIIIKKAGRFENGKKEGS